MPRDGILIDPTHDFGKNTFHGLALCGTRRARGDRLAGADGAVQQGLRRGDAGRPGVTERLEGTLAATALAAAAGARVFRAHEVAATRRYVEMVASIVGTRAPARTVRALA